MLVDLKTGVVTLKEPVSYMSMAPIIKNAMLQMVHKAGIPNTGSHCRRCPYKGVCSPSIWTEKKLRSRKKTSKQLTLELLDE